MAIAPQPPVHPEEGPGKSFHNNSTAQHDAVFGELREHGPNYRDVGWLGTVVLIMKTQIGLGVLSVPAAFNILGIVPGVICLCAVGGITSWSGYIVGSFKLNHPEVYGIEDAGALMFGRIGREGFGAAFCLYWVFVAGSAMLGLSIGLNSVSTHGLCTATFVAFAAILGFLLSSIRTLGKITWLAWVGLVCLVSAIFIVTIAVGIQDRPEAAPKNSVWVSDYKITNDPSFTDAVTAVSTFILAYSGTPAYFNIISEMRDPHHYTRSLIVAQCGITVIYIAIGCVVYYFCGSYVSSPAMGSAGGVVKKISYGVALPGLLASLIITSHLPAKLIFMRLLRGTEHLTSNSFVHWSTWLACTFGVTIVAYIIASAIPVFESLVSLVGALLGTLISFQPMGCMWLYDNWTKGKQERSVKWMLMVGWSVFVIMVGSFLTVAGTYSSAKSIADSYRENGGTSPWSCADNSNST
ncbi:putative amino acid transporter [Dactylonectria estremocensis]|uniref:Amino acid transporter n=1 Tax=Dactylonectria estremocensis TaxID=1079267 RepID=A0A9P9J4S9_9HYPO|nr:putative amino acid transporter [Dactylonectria estremocensis]